MKPTNHARLIADLAAFTAAFRRHLDRFEARLAARHERWVRQGLLKVKP